VNIGLTAIGGAANWIMCTRKGSGGSVRRCCRCSSYQIWCMGGVDSRPQESVVLSAWHVHVASCLIGQGCKGSCGLGPPRDIWLCWGWLAGDSDGLTNEPTSRVRLTRSCSLSRHSFFFWSIHYCTTTATNIDERPGGRTDKAHSSCPACLANMAPCDQHQSSTSSRGLLACLADPPPGWR
jgi:hypothetical protein